MAPKRKRFFVVKAILDEEKGRYLPFHTTPDYQIEEIAKIMNKDTAEAHSWAWISRRQR